MRMQEHTCSAAVRDYIAFFEGLRPESLDELEQVFASDVHFKDPFNDVTGRAALRQIFEHMFTNTENPAFAVDHWLCDACTASLRWRFSCRLQGLTLTVTGMSFVRFDDQGNVTEHIDYWDPAAGVYEQVPVLGGLMRHLRRRLSATESGQ